MNYITDVKNIEEVLDKIGKKDSLTLISYKGGELPISVVKKILTDHPDIVVKEFEDRGDEVLNKINTAYVLGGIVSGYKEKDIKILIDGFDFLFDKDVKEEHKVRSRRPKTKDNPTGETAFSAEEAPAERARRGRRKKTEADSDELCEFIIKAGGENLRDLVTRRHSEIVTALLEATDAKIGLKTKLQMLLLGEEGWEDIWKIMSKHYTALKKKYGNNK